ncbi:MAG TPA: TetR/AcrR family transcriptional regulator [Burkholderiaceae bacterium]|nr:TetR/AcrR family transcriptional regulator [Burkholderiaceae bacterium]
MPAVALRSPRSDNRVSTLLDAAARLFAEKGYFGTSMRDIAQACGMLPGSLYYHFAAKEDLLVAVYQRGVEELIGNVRIAIAKESEPWARLQAGCAAHLETVLRRSDYAQVLIRVLPDDVPPAAAPLARLRDEYEKQFANLIAALPLSNGADRKALRLMLLGALNWSRIWFDPDARETPRSLARKFVNFLKEAPHG